CSDRSVFLEGCFQFADFFQSNIGSHVFILLQLVFLQRKRCKFSLEIIVLVCICSLLMRFHAKLVTLCTRDGELFCQILGSNCHWSVAVLVSESVHEHIYCLKSTKSCSKSRSIHQVWNKRHVLTS